MNNSIPRTKKEKTYIAIDLKSYYASVECVERGLDPLTTNLLVADGARTDKTVCLAVSPSLKAYGISGRARLFEAKQAIGIANERRRRNAPGGKFSGKSYLAHELSRDPSLELDYIIAPPRMAKYMEISTKIYSIYLKYLSPEDIHIYSIDEIFADVTMYLDTYKMTARELAMTMILDVLATTGITATCGIGTNMYLAKIAMDIGAKHIEPDENGVRIAELDERSYREKLWEHRPLTDFWRVGAGYARKLERAGLYTMGDIALRSLEDEQTLFDMFGINAGLLIDHAWGVEPCTMADVKAYRPASSSISTGQVLHRPYTYDEARIILREMAHLASLDILSKGLVTNQLILTIGYDVENLKDPERRANYQGEIKLDRYGRAVPKHAHGTYNLKRYTSSSSLITEGLMDIFERTVDHALLIRRVNIGLNHIITEKEAREQTSEVQLDMFGLLENTKDSSNGTKIINRNSDKRGKKIYQGKAEATIGTVSQDNSKDIIVSNGSNGTNGLNGSNGSNGSNGTNGLNGSNGSNGTNESNGTNGSNGSNGSNEPSNWDKVIEKMNEQELDLEKEKNMQLALLSIQKKYGKNAILTGTSYLEGATTRERNHQIGGHKA